MESNEKPKHGEGSASPLAVLVRYCLGRPLANREGRSRKIGAGEGVPALGLDGLSSSAYGPEAALSILVAAGAAGLALPRPGHAGHPGIAGDAVRLLPADHRRLSEGGGSYTVAKENLGVNASLLAAAALMLDYVLNVAVGISAGVGALVSAVPALLAAHAAALPRHPGAADARQPARTCEPGGCSRCRPICSSPAS